MLYCCIVYLFTATAEFDQKSLIKLLKICQKTKTLIDEINKKQDMLERMIQEQKDQITNIMETLEHKSESEDTNIIKRKGKRK